MIARLDAAPDTRVKRAAALVAIRASLGRGEWPHPLLVADLLRASGVGVNEARGLIARYADAIAPSGEARVLDALRGFGLGGGTN